MQEMTAKAVIWRGEEGGGQATKEDKQTGGVVHNLWEGVSHLRPAENIHFTTFMHA